MTSDVGLLLQDMGGWYEAAEVEYIMAEVDPDGIGIVELAHLIRWWCAEPEEEEDEQGSMR